VIETLERLSSGASALAVGGAFAFAFVLLRLHAWWRDRRARQRLAEAARLELDVPTSLHPVIDPDVCIGSGSCLSACPEGDILGIVGGVATLINASACIGHGRCAVECPVGAIKLVFGSARRGVELPEVDAGFESSRPGVYVVGELGGMGLIKNALVQGLQVAAGIAEQLTPRPAPRTGIVDVAIVGAGPAGLAAAAGARAAGLSCRVIEQDSLGGTVAHYPRHKIVMTSTVELPYYGSFGKRTMSKEELLEAMLVLKKRARVRVHEGAKVTGIDGELGDFRVATTRGSLHARRVVLATGRRGSPRPLGVPGEAGRNVTYRLIETAQYEGKRVLVVGGGDSAVEAAIQLAGESSAKIALVYRRPELARCRPLNKQKLDALVKGGRVNLLLSTEVISVAADAAELQTKARRWSLPIDYVIACLGGELPTQFLEAAGVKIHRHDGRRTMANPALANRSRARRGRLGALKLVALGSLVIAALAVVGADYYHLPRALRYDAPLHALLKPSGLWGHGIGILATLLMFTNFLYSARKRLGVFKGRSEIAPWLRFHVFVGIMSPLTILFHSAFQWGNQLATTTYVSLVVVVVTGLVGRYIYGWFKLDADHAAEVAALRERVGRTLKRMEATLAPEGTPKTPALAHVFALVAGAPARAGGPALFFGRPREAWSVRRGLAATRGRFLDTGSYRVFRQEALRLRHLYVNEQFHARFKGLMRAWRVFHVLLAVTIVPLIGLHVWLSLRLGFKWLWS
jgi:dihydropyrimidine dehydrogenase (NAD+) subunit PreT